MRKVCLTLLFTVAVGTSGCAGGSKALPSYVPARISPAVHERAAAFQTLYRFQNGADGANPGSIVFASGAFYGTASGGNVTHCNFKGCGVLYKVTIAGSQTALAEFPIGGKYAERPQDDVVYSGGTLYGTASSYREKTYVYTVSSSGQGRVLARVPGIGDSGLTAVHGVVYGASITGGAYGLGSVYAITSAGKLRTIYSFKGGNDTSWPDGYLVERNGTLYGTAQGSKGTACTCAAIFSITLAGQERVIHRFPSGSMRTAPVPVLTVDANGAIYGALGVINSYGLCASPSPLCGAIFALTPHGGRYGYRIVYQFLGGSDGMAPNGGLVVGANGVLYGSTGYGGDLTCNTKLGCGTVFELVPGGAGFTKTTLHAFEGGDGASPYANLIGNGGALYGTTIAGGGTAAACPAIGGPVIYPAGCGTIFKIVP